MRDIANLQNDRIDELRAVVAPIDGAIEGPKLHAVGREGLKQRLQFRVRGGHLAEPGRPAFLGQDHWHAVIARARSARSARS
jgi:hypothetical protein